MDESKIEKDKTEESSVEANTSQPELVEPTQKRLWPPVCGRMPILSWPPPGGFYQIFW